MTRPAVTLHLGDCLVVLRTLPDASVDAVVTDPPYGLSFMGKRWDYDVPAVEVWAECLRVLKPGGHLLAFAGTRTQHRMAVRIEDAGFEVRDLIAWVYGSGFPKSLDVSKAIDRAAGLLQPEAKGFSVAGYSHAPEKLLHTAPSRDYVRPLPATDAARQWHGWGTALKPALEPITVARKPLAGTVAETVLAYGTGAINVDGCRVGEDTITTQAKRRRDSINGTAAPDLTGSHKWSGCQASVHVGRWPSNLIHDGGPDVTDLLGDAARFFYCAKASRADRDAGCEELPELRRTDGRKTEHHVPNLRTTARSNHHPTVKPTDLMRYLCRLVTRPGGVVLDPFMGSGSTGRGAVLEGFAFVGIEREADYLTIAQARIEAAQQEAQAERPQLSLFDQVAD